LFHSGNGISGAGLVAIPPTDEELFAAKDRSVDDAHRWAQNELLKRQPVFADVPSDWPTDGVARVARAATSLSGFFLLLHWTVGKRPLEQTTIEKQGYDLALGKAVSEFNRDMRELMNAFAIGYYEIARKATGTKVIEIGDWSGRSVGSIVWEIGSSLHTSLTGGKGGEGYQPVTPGAKGSFSRLRTWVDETPLCDLKKLEILMTDELDAINRLLTTQLPPSKPKQAVAESVPPDGPVPPNKLWFNGKSFELEKVPFALITYMWGKDKAVFSQLTNAVWPDDAPSDGAFHNAKARVNAVLVELGYPKSLSKRQEFVLFE
jgi:hypothetical protein